MKLIARTAAAAVLLSLPMTLAACGGGGSKPSKADAATGYAKIMQSKGISSSVANKVATCTLDKTYDKLSAKTLNAMKSGSSSSKGDAKDETTLKNATTTCATAAVKGS
ncbi:hypothetical protein [Flexivirga caeni]|uniref:DUF732 domain-containing protein n=1 Tax=Flexivirga caeni TaxID=2294115 RepID=A0A3M9MAG4_9MICO|nr:hypothetical protein [Flexivirga caeni]RNI22167.1 hypothetical protein EFY87_09300 [Flexivirga caeni]